jgi:hypothetical protein
LRITVDQQDAAALFSESDSEIEGSGRLANATFNDGNSDDATG